MVAPAMTYSAAANILASGSLAASGTTTADVDLSAKFEGQFQFKNTGGGSVAGTNGLKIEWFKRAGTTPDIDTEPMGSLVIPTTVSTTKYASVHLPTGKWRFRLTNLDASNAITVQITGDTVDSVS